MVNKNQPEDKAKNEVTIIESLADFQSALVEINTALDKLLHQIQLDSARLKELQKKLRHQRVLWPFEEAKQHLHVLVTT